MNKIIEDIAFSIPPTRFYAINLYYGEKYNENRTIKITDLINLIASETDLKEEKNFIIELILSSNEGNIKMALEIIKTKINNHEDIIS